MRNPRKSMSVPTKKDLLDLLDLLETAASDMMRRWNQGHPIEAAVRDEIAVRIYRPVLLILIRAKRRRESGPP